MATPSSTPPALSVARYSGWNSTSTRLFHSLTYARIDPGMTKAEIFDATMQVLEANTPLLRENEDYWVTQRISSGVKVIDGEDPTQQGATVVIECMPLPLRSRASFFRDGVPAQVAARRRIPAEALSPNVKSQQLPQHDDRTTRGVRSGAILLGAPLQC